jgi:DNA-3-methyladenine glycosylase II
MFTDAITHLKQYDPILATIIATSPLPALEPHNDYYQELVSSIIGQQLSVKAAASIQKRFISLFDDFPTPEQILETDIEQLRNSGLSRPKATYIRDLAQHIVDGSVTFDTLDQLTNQQIIDELTKVKGIGIWTVHMFLIFCMGRLDVLPTGDLGIRNGIKRLYELDELPSSEAIEQLAKAKNWHPYESVASWYIWQSLDNAPK